MTAFTLGFRARFISLGTLCQVAHQIRRFTREDSAFFFDWLYCRGDLWQALLRDESVLLQPGNWHIDDQGIRVVDGGSGLRFLHDFSKLPGTELAVDESKVAAELPAVRSKYRYLRDKTLRAITESVNCCLFRWEEIESPGQAADLAAEIAAFYGRLNPNIRVIIVSPVAAEEAFGARHLFLKGVKTDQWQGDDAAWDRIFEMTLLWFRLQSVRARRRPDAADPAEGRIGG